MLNSFIDTVDVRLCELAKELCDDAVLSDAVKYVVSTPSKRIRARLLLSMIATHKVTQSAINLACAIELLHNYTLVHDDLPSMDDDDVRRGQPSCHKKYGEGVAILAGDVMQAMTFKILSDRNMMSDIDHVTQLDINNLVADTACRLCSGQSADINICQQMPSLAFFEQIYYNKTGCLIQTSLLSGYLYSNGKDSTYDELYAIAGDIGFMFQVIDDILDHGELTNNAQLTYVALLGLQHSKSLVLELYDKVMNRLLNMSQLYFTQPVMDITQYIYNQIQYDA